MIEFTTFLFYMILVSIIISIILFFRAKYDIEEITLSTNEKIRGIFLEGDDYIEDVETENRYYKTSIVKIEKVKDTTL